MKANPGSTSFNQRDNLGLKTGLTLLICLQGVGAWLPATWLWGVNHLAWFPVPVRMGVPLVGLALVWSPAGRNLGRLLVGKWGPAVLASRTLAYGVVPAAGAVVFWLLRDRVHLLGDGKTLASMISGNRLYHGFDFMTYYLQVWIYQWTGPGEEQQAVQVMAVTSIVWGAAFLAAAAWSARKLGEDPAETALLYGLLILGPVLQMFMGYVEVYAPLTVALLVFLTFLVPAVEGRAPLWKVGAAWAVALFWHLNALFLAPMLAAAALLGRGLRPSGRVLRLVRAFLPAVGALALAAGLYLLSGATLGRILEDFTNVEGGAGVLAPLSGPDGLLDGGHWLDFFNLALMLAGLPAVLIITGWRLRQDSQEGRNSRATALLLGGGLWLVVLMALVHMKLGVPRDWDLLAAHSLVFVLAGWLLLPERGRPERAGPVLGAALVLVLPWFLLNAAPERALARLEAVMRGAAPHPQGLLHEQIGHFRNAAGDPEATRYHFRRAGEVCPANPRFHSLLGTFLLNRGELEGAAAAFARTLQVDSLDVYGLKMAVMTAGRREEWRTVVELARRLKGLGREDAGIADRHGRAAAALGLEAEAMAAFERALALDPGQVELRGELGGLALVRGDFRRAEVEYRALLTARPGSVGGQLGLAGALWKSLPEEDEARKSRLEEVLALIDRAQTAGLQGVADPGMVARWREQISDALNALAAAE